MVWCDQRPKTMVLYYLRYKMLEDSAARTRCLSAFGHMTEEDDRKDAGEVELLGRWSTVGESSGYCICEAPSARSLHSWLVNWAPVGTIEAYPVLDDNAARRVLLGVEKEPFTVDTGRLGDPAREGESLYFIEYRFQPGKRGEGFKAFANMTEEQDREDAGDNTCLGRWHDLGRGAGAAVCSSPSAEALHAWAHHWTELCDCRIVPVVSDAECRANIRAKPQYAPPAPPAPVAAAPRGGGGCCSVS